jgi:hypothetical protein
MKALGQTCRIETRVAELIEKHGGLRIAARAIGINYTYLSRLGKGQKTEPTDTVLKKLGLKRAVIYWRTHSQPDAAGEHGE